MYDGLGQIIEETAAKSGFSGVVHVSRAGEIAYEKAFGLADRAHAIPNTIDTQLAIASGAKGLTALAVMSLVDDGAVTLDATARSVLGDVLPLVDPAVTVGHLLAHTSGIGDYLDEDAGGEIDDYVLPVPVHQLATTPDYLAVLGGHPMKSEVGERFAYCNGGYVVLALVIEAVTGSSYHDVVASRVCAPAGMTSTAFFRSDELPGSAAVGYIPNGAAWRTNQLHLPVRGVGDGGAYSTVADFTIFGPALFEGRIVPRNVVAEMVRAHNDVPEDSRRYGLGFWLRQDRDTVQLEGYDAGVSFRSAYDPESQWLYTVFGNTSAGAWPLVRLLDSSLS
jgi:CubicO group peptidase (beta-lactamase class C family)